jgi:beta-lactamase regulating signal transducer with metallopeptidase domain
MSERWAFFQEWWLHTSVGGGLLLLLTWWLMRRCRQPARRQRLGEWGMASALLLAVLCCAPKWLLVPLESSPLPESALTVAVAGAPEPVASEPVRQAAVRTTLFALPKEQEAANPSARPGQPVWSALGPFGLGPADGLLGSPADESPAPADSDPETAPAEKVEKPSAASWAAVAVPLLAVYALCSLSLFTRWLLGYYALQRILRQSGPAPLPVARLFAAMTPGRRPARLLVSGRLRVPISCGLWRPTVVIPQNLCEPRQAERLRWVFAHELTHLQRRDAWASLLFGLGQVVYFLLPWFWWLRRQVRLCQEYVADAAAAEHATCVEDYAQFLLTLTATPAVRVPAAGVAGQSSDLFRRVTMLLESPQRVDKGCPRWWSVGTAGGLLALAVLGAGVGVKAIAAPPPDDDEKVIVVTPDKEGRLKIEGQVQAGGKKHVIVLSGDDVKKEGSAKGEKKHVIVVSPEKGQGEMKVRVLTPDEIKSADGKALKALGVTVIAEPGKGEKKHAIVLSGEQGRAPVKVRVVTPEDLKSADGKVAKALRLTVVDDDDEKPAKKKEGKKKEGEKKIDVQGLKLDLDAILKNLPENVDKDQIRREIEKAMAEVRKAVEQAKREARKAMAEGDTEARKAAAEALKALSEQQGQAQKALQQKLRALQAKKSAAGAAAAEAGHGRLGVNVEQPSAALADQLDLPQGRGLVVVSVEPDSPAAKAGLKVSDVLLEVNGKPVSNEASGLVKQLQELKSGASFNITVLRKGRKETIRGVTLGGGESEGRRKAVRAEPKPEKGTFKLHTAPDVKVPSVQFQMPALAGQGGGIITTNFRTDESFTTRHQEGSLVITITGKVEDGRARVNQISVQDGGSTHKYRSVDQVPEQYRDKVRSLVDMNEKSKTKIEIKTEKKDKKPTRSRSRDKDPDKDEQEEDRPTVH